jgi:hypothetical protein
LKSGMVTYLLLSDDGGFGGVHGSLRGGGIRSY